MSPLSSFPSRDSNGADSRSKYPAKSGERGFALLIVFLMAAAIALMLYQQMPRVAFESERDKEDLLIDRGEQYKRAIYLYLKVNSRYPSRIEDLENTNDKRFLRKRYIDPFTGKNEWRLVHTNGMFLTDSLVQKPPAAPGDDKNKGTSTSASNTTGATGTTANGTTGNGTPGNGTPGTATPPDVNATVFQRPSDRTLPNGLPGQFNPPQTGDPNQVGIGPGQTAFPPITLSQIQGTGPNGQPIGQQGALPPGVVPTSVPGTFQPGLPVPGQFPGQGTDPNQQQGQFPVQQGQLPFGQGPGGVPGLPVAGTPQGGTAGGQNAAINLINRILTQPSTPPPGIGGSNANNSVGGGIAGVASTYEGPSIKSYNTRTKFNEWEFVFQNQQQGVPGQTNTQNNGQQTQNPPTTGTGAPPSPPAQ